MTTASHKPIKIVPGRIPSGNTLPNIWYQKLKTEKGRTDTTTMVILSEIVYQHRSKQELWQTSYEYFTAKFGYHKDTVRRSLVKLEKRNYILREFHEVKYKGQRYNNVLHIRLLPGITDMISLESAEKLEVAASYVTATGDLSSPYPKNKEIDNIDYKNKSINRSIDLSINQFENFERKFCDINRKNPTNNKNKEINSKTLPTGSYSFSNFYPMEEEMLKKINEKSGRDFNREFIHQLLLKLDKKYPNHRFFNKHLFISYMTKVLANELRKENGNSQSTTLKAKKLKIADFSLLKQELLDQINQISGRHFNKNFAEKLIVKLAEKYPNHSFFSEKTFIKYMAEVFKQEMYQESKVNNPNFTLYKAEERVIEKTLEEVETSQDSSQLGQIRRRIVGTFDRKTAYNILQNFIFNGQTIDDKKTYTVTIIDKDSVNLTTIRDKLLEQVRQIYGTSVEEIKFLTQSQYSKSTESSSQSDLEKESTLQDLRDDTEVHPIWLKVKPILINAYNSRQKDYGEKVYISWFSKLDIYEINDGHVILKAPTGFIRDWITNNYLDSITACLQYVDSSFKEVTVIST